MSDAWNACEGPRDVGEGDSVAQNEQKLAKAG